MHRKIVSNATSEAALYKSPRKSRRVSVGSISSPQSSNSQSSKKITPGDHVQVLNTYSQSPRIFIKASNNTPITLHIQKPGIITTTKTYVFEAASQLKEISNNMKFPCEQELPIVSVFPFDDKPNESAESSSVSSISLNRTSAPLAPLSPIICRICLDSSKQEDLIAPCKCNGTQKYVHQECLKLWLLHSDKDEMELSSCELCKCPLKMNFHYLTTCSPCGKEQSCVPWLALFVALFFMIFVSGMFYLFSCKIIQDKTLVMTLGVIFSVFAVLCLLLSFGSALESCFERRVVEWDIENQDFNN
ncbi:unnamed protein product [Blepharisma stoltei]|uniref:RING-CH-type domain-containing protein n=1 Tax=Blepharisma stoltei TaxID=1481888 RepID=A0AAU9IWA8_9CILI|nr:unnamed protein product [Blepharisma stoltei]